MTKPREFMITLKGGPVDGRVYRSLYLGFKVTAAYLTPVHRRWKYADYRYTAVDQKAWTATARYVPTPRKRRKAMPSKSAKQHRLMEGAAHSRAFAKKVGVPMKVAKEFVAADAASGKYKSKGKKK